MTQSNKKTRDPFSPIIYHLEGWWATPIFLCFGESWKLNLMATPTSPTSPNSSLLFSIVDIYLSVCLNQGISNQRRNCVWKSLLYGRLILGTLIDTLMGILRKTGVVWPTAMPHWVSPSWRIDSELVRSMSSLVWLSGPKVKALLRWLTYNLNNW